MALWEKSEAYYDIIGFINAISQCIQGVKNTSDIEISDRASKIINVLDTLTVLLKQTPPIDQPQRFGNKAYRDWSEKLKNSSIQLLQNALPEKLHRAVPEVNAYFLEAFGNPTRIDYGTGHELAFIMFLCCLFKIGALDETDRTATGVKVRTVLNILLISMFSLFISSHLDFSCILRLCKSAPVDLSYGTSWKSRSLELRRLSICAIYLGKCTVCK